MNRTWTNYRAPLVYGARRITPAYYGVIGAVLCGLALGIAIAVVLP